MMQCPECLGTNFEEGLFERPQTFQGRLVLLRNVPAQRCTQCGYLVFGPETGERIAQALERGVGDDTLTIDVFDIARVPAVDWKQALTAARARQHRKA
jgi:YgiT-type zinc finger domain-containing protein